MCQTDTAITPGGCTKFIQPPNVSQNKPFKLYVAEKHDDWMANRVHKYASSGNMKTPLRKKIVQ